MEHSLLQWRPNKVRARDREKRGRNANWKIDYATERVTAETGGIAESLDDFLPRKISDQVLKKRQNDVPSTAVWFIVESDEDSVDELGYLDGKEWLGNPLVVQCSVHGTPLGGSRTSANETPSVTAWRKVAPEPSQSRKRKWCRHRPHHCRSFSTERRPTRG